MAERPEDVESSDEEEEELLVGSHMPSLSALPSMLPEPSDPAVDSTLAAYLDAGLLPEKRTSLPGSEKVDGSQVLGKMRGMIGKVTGAVMHRALTSVVVTDQYIYACGYQ